MKKFLKQIPFSAAVILLAGCVSLAGIHVYRESLFAHVGSLRLEKPVVQLDLSNTPLDNLEDIAALSDLQALNVRGTGLTIAQYEQLHENLPECDITWDVPFQEGFLTHDTEQLTLTKLRREDIAVLDYLPNLSYIDATACTDYALLAELAAHRPQCHVDYAIVIDADTYPLDTQEVTFPGEASAMLLEYLPHLPELKKVTLTEPLGDSAALLALEEALPNAAFSWSVSFLDMTLDKDTTTTLDLTKQPVTVEQIENLIPYLPNLTYVDMSHCGISNEDMDALNRRHENVKIVWTVELGPYFEKKTDALYFMPGKYPGKYVSTKDCYNLRYCTDMICIDLGHMKVKNCEWAAYMPNLQYLLLADTWVTDISPIAGLEKLKFLEIFLTDVEDYTPLLECPGLEDINLHYTYGDPEIIKQLTWVNNVWWRNIHLTEEQRQELREALPETHFEFWVKASTGAGWRKLQNYFDHRDILGMWYMD